MRARNKWLLQLLVLLALAALTTLYLPRYAQKPPEIVEVTFFLSSGYFPVPVLLQDSGAHCLLAVPPGDDSRPIEFTLTPTQFQSVTRNLHRLSEEPAHTHQSYARWKTVNGHTGLVHLDSQTDDAIHSLIVKEWKEMEQLKRDNLQKRLHSWRNAEKTKKELPPSQPN